MTDYEDVRIQKTRAKIFEAFANLMQSQEFDTISVAAICKEAHISRATFYHHYATKEDIVVAYQKIIMAQIYRLMTNSDHDLLTYFERLARYLDNNAELLGALLSEHGTLTLQMQIREKMASFFQAKMLPQLQTTTAMDPMTAEYAAHFYASAIFGFLQHWLQETPRQTPEEMSKILRTILANGLAI